MARRCRKLRVCKWVGTVGCGLIAGAFVFSGWWNLQFAWNEARPAGSFRDGSAPYCYLMRLDYGCAGFGHCRNWGPSGWALVRYPTFTWPLSSAAGLPSFEQSSERRYWANLPLGFPFVVLLVPTLLLWWGERPKPRPGFCPRCDYDLTGNTSGVCPECGQEVAAPNVVGAADRRE